MHGLKKKLFLVVFFTLFIVFSGSKVYAEAIAPSAINPIQMINQTPKGENQRVTYTDQNPTLSLRMPTKNKITEKPFRLVDVTINGSSAFSQLEIRPVYEQYIGKLVTHSDINHIANLIVANYEDYGYTLISTKISFQKEANGQRAFIHITEGFINNVEIQGETYKIKYLLKAYGERIKCQHPMKLALLQHYVILLNSLPGVTVKFQMVPTNIETGEYKLVYIVKQRRFDPYVTVTNNLSPYYGDHLGYARITGNSLFFGGDSSSLVYAISNVIKRLHYAQIFYQTLISPAGTTFNFNATSQRTHPGLNLSPLNIIEKIDLFNFNITHPLLLELKKRWYIHLIFSTVNDNLRSLGMTVSYEKLRILRFGTIFQIADDWKGKNNFSFDISQGLNILGAEQLINPNAIILRPIGNVDYTSLLLYAAREQEIYGRFSVLLATQGQYAFRSLITTQKFTYGGRLFGRGYDSGEIFGDHGVNGSIEFRYNFNPSAFVNSIQPYVFYDFGIVWNRNTSGGLPKRTSGTSAGIGSRFTFSRGISATVEVNKPLTHKIASQVATNKNPRPLRFFLVFQYLPENLF